MSYSFLDAFASVQTADSSVVSGTTQRPKVDVGSVFSVVPVSFSGSPSISGAVTIVGTPSISGTINVSGTPSVSGTVNIGFMPTSVTAFQATNPWVIGSLVGTYAEDSASADGDKALLVLGVRNDAVASLVGTDKDYSVQAFDSAGRSVIKPFAPEESRIEGYASVVSTSVTTLVGSAGAGLRNYITDVWIANTGATTTLVTFKDGLGSILGYTIAPTAGGSNLVGLNTPIRTQANTTFDFQATSATSILFATVKGFKAP